MLRTARMLALTLGALAVVLFGAGRVTAQTVVISPPGVSYCAPAPAVTYYSPPAVSYYSPPVLYTPAPAVSYYYGGSVSYYTPAPAVSYYAPAVPYYAGPTAVTTTRYGLFGRPRVSTTYYPPVYIGR